MRFIILLLLVCGCGWSEPTKPDPTIVITVSFPYECRANRAIAGVGWPLDEGWWIELGDTAYGPIGSWEWTFEAPQATHWGVVIEMESRAVRCYFDAIGLNRHLEISCFDATFEQCEEFGP